MVYSEVAKTIQPVYLVGGSVRDEVMGNTPKDWDFCTPLLPDEIESAIRAVGKKPYLIGKRFGTISMKINGEVAEITTFRSEQYVKGSRKPIVEYVDDITADLSRRDFTMNAMALRCDKTTKSNTKLIDPFGGVEDIKNRLIKCVGSPTTRFREDPLRMLRAARFASQFNFDIDLHLKDRATSVAHKILIVSKERWGVELDKLLMSDGPSLGLEFLMQTRLINYMIPELAIQYKYNQNNPHHQYDLWDHTLGVVEYSPKDIETRWAALLHDIGKPFIRVEKTNPDRGTYAKHDLLGAEMVDKIGRYLKWSNDRREKIVDLVLNHQTAGNPLRWADHKAKGDYIDDKWLEDNI
jgi:putative nucleotidyltransferase with HDIG domain